jgi:hypothetical protein
MVRVTGRNCLNEREARVETSGQTRDEILELIIGDANHWLEEHGPAQKKWVAPFTELERTPAKR